MSLFTVPHSANDVRILKVLRWRDLTEKEIQKKVAEMYPQQEVDVRADLMEAIHKGFVGSREKRSVDDADKEFFITKRGLDVLEPPKKKKEE